MKTVYVAIMGLGTVGGGTYEILKTNHDKIAAAYDVDIRVKKVLDRDEKKLLEKVEPGQVCLNLEEILADSEISIVIEVMGGVEPAKTFIEKCMKAGKERCHRQQGANLQALGRNRSRGESQRRGFLLRGFLRGRRTDNPHAQGKYAGRQYPHDNGHRQRHDKLYSHQNDRRGHEL